MSLLDRYDRNDALLHEVNEAYQDMTGCAERSTMPSRNAITAMIDELTAILMRSMRRSRR
ncbi:MAG: hypothetical protein ACLVJ6_15345 [Merdibacter sp.]